MKGTVRLGAHKLALLSALPLVLGTSALHAQDLQPRAVPPPASIAGLPPIVNDDQVSFAADNLDYDDKSEIVTATGDVRMARAGKRMRADKIVWNRADGKVTASGNVAVINPGGDTMYGDRAVLDEDMKNGIVENILFVLNDGGRLAARHARRKDNIAVLDHAAYTPCRVATDSGCPKTPSWKITALRIVHNDKTHRIYYKDARFQVFGVPVLWLPTISHPDGSNAAKGAGGLLLPTVQLSHANGLEYDQPFYWHIGPNRDLTLTPRLYTKVLPALQGQYRQLDDYGAFQVNGMVTYGSRLPATVDTTGLDTDRDFRGYIDANGTYQLGPNWTIHGQLRLETDRTFMQRYDINFDDRLRSTLEADRIDNKSLLSIQGWFVQTVQIGESQGQEAFALPQIDYRRRIADPLLGGMFQVEANTLGLTRTSGQSTQRAFVSAQWDLRKLTPLGQEITLTGYARGDLYHTDDITDTATTLYRGLPGWQGRGIAALALDVKWPFIGGLWGGAQTITPRIQFVATPRTKNISIPDEDSRAIDLDDSNLFALNRFSGYDRWDDSSRVTYGAEWNYARPKVEFDGVIGQSYRLVSDPVIFPSGTGLTHRFSDYVGRLSIKYGPWVEITERFRLDKDNLHLRRNEIDATIGSKKTYLLIGYLLLNRNIDPSIEDLRDEQEIRLGARVQFARYWSLYGDAVIDLTSRRQDPTSLSDGFQPVRNRVGVAYEDECMTIEATWRQDFNPVGDARRGSTFALRLALKNLGR
jgi:LPS-assembly protein